MWYVLVGMWNNFGEVDVFVGQKIWEVVFLLNFNLVSGCVCLCFVLLVCSPVEQKHVCRNWVQIFQLRADVCRLPSQSSPLTLSPGHPWVEVRSFVTMVGELSQMTFPKKNPKKNYKYYSHT